MTARKPEEPARFRLDKWLWVARFARSRALAQAMCLSGHIRLNGQRVEKNGREIRPGDVLTLPRGREILIVRVLDSAPRRGPASDATVLYEILEE
jgi:ribosome-associated heat shock protein Hsp15